MSRGAKRWLSVAVTVILGVAIVAADTVTWASLREPRFLTGWILFGLMVALTIFNARKKLPFLPLGSAAAWLRFHVYAGWLSFVLYFLHVGFRLPQGALEVSLAAMYVVVAVSGVTGLAISRNFAKRLTNHGEELLFERIPVLIKSLRDACDQRILKSVTEVESAHVANFYTSDVRPFLDRSNNFILHLFGSNRTIHAFDKIFNQERRYLDDDEEKTLDWLLKRVREKHHIDYAYALQATLKGWLFVHVPLTYGMLLLSVVHVILVYAFTGGMS